MWTYLTVLCFGLSLVLDLTGQSEVLVTAGIVCGWISLAAMSIISHLYIEGEDE
jgi:hypothetical protein